MSTKVLSDLSNSILICETSDSKLLSIMESCLVKSPSKFSSTLSNTVFKDVKSSNNKSTFEKNENSGFVPLRDVETSQNVSGVEAISSSSLNNGSVKNITTLGSSGETTSEGLDVLPEMSSLSTMDENSGYNSNDEDDNDNGFELSYTSSNRKSDSFVGDMPDTGLIAKAISSVLSQESS